MTLPEQSDRAVAQTRDFLVRLTSPYVEGGIKGIRREVRAEALRLLRHYPLSWNGDCPDADNAATQDILTDEEREVLDRVRIAFRELDHNDMTMQQIDDYEAICDLLERTK